MSDTLIATNSGNLNISYMRNSDELFEIFNKLIDEGKIKRDQISYEMSFWQKITRLAYVPAIIISSISWPIIISIFKIENYWLNKLGFLLVFFPLFYLFFIIFRNRS
jgi:hypothetical protein